VFFAVFSLQNPLHWPFSGDYDAHIAPFFAENAEKRTGIAF
jgi:hypothetical protein